MAATVIEASLVVFEGGRVQEGPLYVTIEEERIVSIANTPPTPCPLIIKTHLLIPGFIDLHTHGLGGANDVIEFWSNPDYTLSRLPKVGTTSCLATIVLPKGHPGTPTLLDALKNAVGVVNKGAAVLEGINAEGPVVNDYGGLPVSDQLINIKEFEQLIESIPCLKLMTISPHLEANNGYQRIQALLKHGIKPSLGHDKVATENEILGALRLSKNPLHVTHLYNVCSFNHRQPGLVNIGLLSHFPNLPQYKDLTPPTVEVIGDLAHVHPLSLSLLLQCKGYDSVSFITDSVYHSNTPGEKINYNGRHLIVSEDCKTLRLEGTDTIAGSCSSMLDIFYNLINILQVPLGQAVRMMTENPAKVANLQHIGTISVNKRADLLLMNKDLSLTHTIIAGNIVFKI